ncbi:hypothetical protein IJT10_03655 [bacterium]|nr:hypothetical protein [bacterium]
MIFYALDAAWDKSKNNTLGQFLSEANPFLFTDCNSADPAIFQDFCKQTSKTINVEDSYDVALRYIDSLNTQEIKLAFGTISRHEWTDGVNKYLSSLHKS